jgi:hypothetical protein
MFRLMQLKPPHGWNAVAWELAIVTLGVLIALAAQQWAEDRSLRSKVDASKTALSAELGEHYDYAVEFRTVYPCLQAQVSQLRDRVLKSGAALDPAPVYQGESFHYVLRLPSKAYPMDAWQAMVSDGTVQRLAPPLRRQLAGHYGQLPVIGALTSANDAAEWGLFALTHPLPLDPSVRYSIMKEIEQVRGRLEYLDLVNGQVIDYVEHAGMVPPASEAQAVTERYGTYQFCKAHGLPMRSFVEAMQPVPN